MSEQRGETFSGTVWADPVMPATDGVTINTVFFAPRGRTYWHAHEHGQVLQVTAGKGWVCKEGESDGSYMVHIATSIGKSMWQEEVADADYPQGLGAR